jgi:uncharacterized protein YbcI
MRPWIADDPDEQRPAPITPAETDTPRRSGRVWIATRRPRRFRPAWTSHAAHRPRALAPAVRTIGRSTIGAFSSSRIQRDVTAARRVAVDFGRRRYRFVPLGSRLRSRRPRDVRLISPIGREPGSAADPSYGDRPPGTVRTQTSAVTGHRRITVSDRSAAQAISCDVASIHAAGYERAVERISTIFEADSVTCELHIVLSPAEEVLLEHHHAAVRDQRESFDHTLEPACKAAVERATGRRVDAFLTKTRLSPHVTLLVFVLGRPRPQRR